MATKYCDQHQIWYDYNESCPECGKVGRIVGNVIGNVIGGAIVAGITAGKKIDEHNKKQKELNRAKTLQQINNPNNLNNLPHRKTRSGCYIATVCYGSYDCIQVLTFRNFRDEYLKETFAGQMFIKTYYALSPTIAQWLENKQGINIFIRKIFLDKIYNLLKEKYQQI
jgi:hypothetical protein